MELEKIKEFINLIGSYPEIYAIGQSDYKNMYKKEMAWKRIKEKLGMDIKKLKIKWRNLRDTYIKHRNCRRTGTQGPNTLYNWVWANEMAFVEPYIQTRSKTAAKSVDSTDSDVNVITDDENKEKDAQNIQIPEPETEKIKRRSIKRRRQESDGDTAAKLMATINTEISTERNAPETVVEVPCDRTDMQFLGYANTAKKLSLRSQALIKFQIAKILTRYQLQELNHKNCYDDSNATELSNVQPYFIDVETYACDTLTSSKTS